MTIAKKKSRIPITNDEVLDDLAVFPSEYGQVTMQLWLRREMRRLERAGARPKLIAEEGKVYIEVEEPKRSAWS